MKRRVFLGTPALLAQAENLPQPPPVTTPRATSGDSIEPRWEQGLSITVGPEKADLVGADHRAVQAGVDYVAGLGGGTVRLLPGVFRFRNAVQLRSGVRVAGSGLDTVCVNEPGFKTALVQNSDWYDQEITVQDASGFAIGDGIVLRTRNPHNGGEDIFRRTLVARSGNRFKLNQMLQENYWIKEGASASRVHSLFEGYRIADAVVENICLDGNRANTEFLNGNYVGCIFLRESNRIRMRQVTARNFNGDGISYQVCHDVRVEDCTSHNNANYGLHPGSGSQRTVVTGCRLDTNDIGFFFCWGVKWALVERNTMADNRRFGVSIGHNDTDNVVRNNEVLRSGKFGIYLRQEHGHSFAPSRNRIEGNRVVDSGNENGAAVEIEGPTEHVSLQSNVLLETRGAASRVGVRIGKEAKAITLAENRIEGFSTPVADLRKG
ncbi:MAG: right-handed parallel beta-helix repeat-containing protein [Bryobacterales bacterium]|nr:right-handed parallel beta-helix repeat-containing protein [Bryobacterales bacterium]